ncbi:Uncharacterized protein Rs2_03534 [Raphanus sativus]|nr:Uncharacterized protein Rs2_03534 [Raphanus sativus]
MSTRGMVTSYKVKVWHGGKVELVHTWEEQEQEVVIRGGVSSAFSSSDFSDESDIDINEWNLHGITGYSNECVQVERRSDKKMISCSPRERLMSQNSSSLRSFHALFECASLFGPKASKAKIMESLKNLRSHLNLLKKFREAEPSFWFTKLFKSCQNWLICCNSAATR